MYQMIIETENSREIKAYRKKYDALADMDKLINGRFHGKIVESIVIKNKTSEKTKTVAKWFKRYTENIGLNYYL